MRGRIDGRRATGCFLAAWVLLGAAATDRADVADKVYEAVRAARTATGVPSLVRRDDLDGVAREHAERIAALPPRRRLAAREDLGGELRAAGIDYARVDWHVDSNRGYRDPADAFARSWADSASGWSTALSADHDAIGLAAVHAEDGWIVLVAVLLAEPATRPAPRPAELESETLAATSRARVEHGLARLQVDETLSSMAREHSRDMQRRRFFDHRAPDGTELTDRVRRHGLRVARIGEILHCNRGVEDPVATAVEAWLASPEHRELLLSSEFRKTGVGIAPGPDGSLCFTQLFLVEPAASGDGPP